MEGWLFMQNCLLRVAASLDASDFRVKADKPSRRREARNDEPCQNPAGRVEWPERDVRVTAGGAGVAGAAGDWGG